MAACRQSRTKWGPPHWKQPLRGADGAHARPRGRPFGQSRRKCGPPHWKHFTAGRLRSSSRLAVFPAACRSFANCVSSCETLILSFSTSVALRCSPRDGCGQGAAWDRVTIFASSAMIPVPSSVSSRRLPVSRSWARSSVSTRRRRSCACWKVGKPPFVNGLSASVPRRVPGQVL